MNRESKRKTPNEIPELGDFVAWQKRLKQAESLAFKQSRDRPMLPVRHRPDSIYKRAIYQYFCDLTEAGLIVALRKFIENRDGTKWSLCGDQEEFWVLRLLAVNGETDRERQVRSRLAAQLKLAAINRVRSPLLLGFLHEAGTLEQIERDARNEVEYSWAKYYQKHDDNSELDPD